jgi:hypothetical protein
MSSVRDRVRERVNERLPASVWNCEACNSTDSMKVRRSSLNEQFLADDTGLKCMNCWHYRTHGIPFEDASVFHKERRARGRRVVDFTRDASGEPDKERLRALGYLGATTQE